MNKFDIDTNTDFPVISRRVRWEYITVFHLTVYHLATLFFCLSFGNWNINHWHGEHVTPFIRFVRFFFCNLKTLTVFNKYNQINWVVNSLSAENNGMIFPHFHLAKTDIVWGASYSLRPGRSKTRNIRGCLRQIWTWVMGTNSTNAAVWWWWIIWWWETEVRSLYNWGWTWRSKKVEVNNQ